MLAQCFSVIHRRCLHDAGTSRVLLCGKSFIADPTGALFWPAENTLIVADLQLSKCSYLEGEDVVLPPYDTASAFEKLEDALDRYDPSASSRSATVSPVFHLAGSASIRATGCKDMMEDREWYWVCQDLAETPDGIGGTIVPYLVVSGIKFRAEPVRAPVANEIAGGLHPVAQVSQYGHLVRGRCFVSNGMRMILPSLGNYSAGTNVLSSDFDPLLGQGGLFVWFISQERVTAVASPQLTEDRAA